MDEDLEKTLIALSPDTKLKGFFGQVANSYVVNPGPSEAVQKEKEARSREVERDQKNEIELLKHQHQVEEDRKSSFKGWFLTSFYLVAILADISALIFLGYCIFNPIADVNQEHLVYMFGALIAAFCWLANCLRRP